MEHSPGEHVIFEGHPSWRSILDVYIKGALAAAVVAVPVYFIEDTGAAVLAFAVLFGATVVTGYVRRMATTYTITSRRLHIKRGIIARKTQEARLERVQNVNTNQGVLERVLQIGTVDFDTAGSDDSEFTFDGVASPDSVVRAVDQAQREHQAERPPGERADEGL
jgi:uncharacterized membrane protein YdbT with pleckstrin-like domain